MAINFDTALGIHQQALGVRTARAQLIANNLANSDTPNFKARDIDFRHILANADSEQQSDLRLSRTNTRHQSQALSNDDMIVGEQEYALMYRTPIQDSVDGNTVDEHLEHSEFLENALAFQASFTFLNKKFMGLKSAIRGE